MTTPVAKHVRRTSHAAVVQTQELISTVLDAKRTAEQSGIHGLQLTIALPVQSDTALLAVRHIYNQLQEDKHTNCAFDDKNGTIVINLT